MERAVKHEYYLHMLTREYLIASIYGKSSAAPEE